MIRLLRLPLAVLALSLSALSSTTAHAQAGVYGMFSVERLSGIQSSPLAIAASPAGAVNTTYDSNVNPLGFTGGVFYDFKTFGPVRLGADVRGSILTAHRGAQTCCDGAGTRIESGLGGIRASFHGPKSWIKPYVEGAAGIGRSNYGISGPTNPTSSTSGLYNNLEYHVYAGTDLDFASFASWRVFEVGYGALTATGNSSHTYPLLSISTGVVLHFPSH